LNFITELPRLRAESTRDFGGKGAGMEKPFDGFKRRSARPRLLKLNPNGVVPTLVHEGNVLVESTVIMHYLDDTFPTPPLMPHKPLDRSRAHYFTKLMDEYIHPACIVFTFATANRGPLASLSQEQRNAQLAKALGSLRSIKRKTYLSRTSTVASGTITNCPPDAVAGVGSPSER
jgi:glutathione S-transferase